MIRLFFLIRYLFIFAWELIIANYQVTKLVLSPNPKFRSGFLALPMEATTDFEVTTLANSITLTPGTISVHVVEDRNTLVIHAIDIGDDPQQLRDRIKNSLEANILKFTRPGKNTSGDSK